MKKAGFSIAVPDDWFVFQQTRKDLEALLEANPQLGDLEDLLDNAERTPLRAAYNVGSNGVAEASLTVEFERGVKLLSPVAMAKAELEAEGTPFDDVEVRRTKVGGRRALRAEASVDITPPGGEPVRARITFYRLLTGKGLLSLGFTEAETADHSETFETMIRTVKILR